MQLLRRFLVLLLSLLLLGTLLTSCQEKGNPDVKELQYLHLTWGVGGPLPEAKDFVKSLPEGYTAQFAKEYQFSDLGDYDLTVTVTDPKGRTTSQNVKFTLIVDDQAPVITGVKDLSVYVGDGVSYRAGVYVSDNCDAPVSLQIDSSLVDTSTEGSYLVVYTATDAVGNAASVTATVYVYQERITEEVLWAEIDRLILQHISPKATAEQKAREVYAYVYYNVSYADTSDKNDWVRAAYEGIRTGQGDCFAYFALSKAFFTRLGIETRDVQRTEGIVAERHYWNMVNIGGSENARWYHFDACRIRGESPPFGCLMTDAQIAAFSRQKTDAAGVSDYFYAYDAASYPKTDTKIITQTSYD